MAVAKDDDLIMITADHGNDPTHSGTDHTREKVPLIVYNRLYQHGRLLNERSSFADIGATLLENYRLKMTKNQIGHSISTLIIDQ
jgi:phosphopentomutase